MIAWGSVVVFFAGCVMSGAAIRHAGLNMCVKRCCVALTGIKMSHKNRGWGLMSIPHCRAAWNWGSFCAWLWTTRGLAVGNSERLFASGHCVCHKRRRWEGKGAVEFVHVS